MPGTIVLPALTRFKTLFYGATRTIECKKHWVALYDISSSGDGKLRLSDAMTTPTVDKRDLSSGK